ncbi:MAG: glycerol-3-phosphate 1-O-acyltransferase PlsY [Ruminococcaceae bacterium]|nr:glycerol-3-phosphate 1-O-acyltransferase PlsY [Oscillospiraceae bacterium]
MSTFFDVLRVYGLTAIVGYLLGSISFAIIFTWFFTKNDVRTSGSGNAGATNVFRTAGAIPGTLTFVLDMAKGAVAVILGRLIFEKFGAPGINDPVAASQIGACVAGLFAVLGHLFPVFFGFRGGKGVLTLAGIIFMIDPLPLPVRFLALLIVFAISAVITKTVSISSMAAAAAYPIVTFIRVITLHCQQPQVYSNTYWIIETIVAVIFGATVFITHRENIKRIIAGTEPKFSIKKKGE